MTPELPGGQHDKKPENLPSPLEEGIELDGQPSLEAPDDNSENEMTLQEIAHTVRTLADQGCLETLESWRPDTLKNEVLTEYEFDTLVAVAITGLIDTKLGLIKAIKEQQQYLEESFGGDSAVDINNDDTAIRQLRVEVNDLHNRRTELINHHRQRSTKELMDMMQPPDDPHESRN